MASDFYARIMQTSDNNDNIPNHQFFALLREYVRNPFISLENIYSHFSLSGSDALLNDLFSYIDGGYDELGKINRIKTLEDIFLIHENFNTSSFFPDRESLRNRIGI